MVHGTPPRPRAQRARQVASVLREKITTGSYPDGMLPDERTLSRSFGASRNAVREALSLLRAEGLITRTRGVGTAVVMPKYGHPLDRLAGLAEALTDHGEITNEVRAAHHLPRPPQVVRERLNLAAGDSAVYVERLRWLGGVPLSLDTTYLTADIGHPLLERDLDGRDLFSLIEETTGARLGRSEIAVHAVTADADTAALLNIPAAAAVFAMERLTHTADGRPVDAESIQIRADRLALHATVHRTPWPGR